MHRIGIVYAPDYVVNAGGLISVYDEYEYGNTRVKRVEERIHNIKKTLKKILDESKREKVPTNIVADTMAKEIIASY